MLASHQRSHSISSPLEQSIPTAFSSPAFPAVSVVRPAHKPRRPSLTNTMSKFKDSLKERLQDNVQAVHGHVHRRAQSNGSARGSDGPGPYDQRSVYISEPRLNNSADSLPSTRLAPLGSGAIVVGTPQEALALSAQRGGYRGPLAAASMPSRINQLHKQHPEPVEEEETEYDDMMQKSLPSTPFTPLAPQSSRPNSPVPRSLQQRDIGLAQPRRSGESSASASGSGSRGLGPVLPDRRSQTSASAKSNRGSPLAQSNNQLHPRPHPHSNESQVHQLRPGAASALLNRPKSDPEYQSQSTPAPGEAGMQQRHVRQPGERKSGTDAIDANADGASRPKTHFSSFSDPGCRHEVESDCFSSAPQLPIDLATALPQPLFEPVLMTNLPANMHKYDPGKVIVVLETGDATMKSTLKTLTSRPSYLAAYLSELVASTGATNISAQIPIDENADGASVYSQHGEDSEGEENYAGFNSLFQDHLKSTGVLKPRKPKRRADATSLIHVFLDRPSAPYGHIIAYLRAPILSSHPEGMLPYAARLFPAARHSFATARLEALLDLRDEAAYLGLTDLMRLCDEELAGQVPLAADAGRSSVHSTHTLCNSSVDGGQKGKEGSSVENTPAVHSVDIPIVLPMHESRVVPPPAKTDSLSKQERREVGAQVPSQRVNRIPNASQLRAQGVERARPHGNYF